MSPRAAARRIAGSSVLVAVLLAGCAGDGQSLPEPDVSASAPAIGEAAQRPTTPPEALSAFEQQLPLTGSFVSQAVATEGTVRVERRDDGSVWLMIEGLRTSDSPDLRVHLKPDPLQQDAQGHWGTAAGGHRYEIATIDPTVPDHAVELPGAHDMPAMMTVTLFEYVEPFPSFGSAALG
ncbi:hypothetical protein [Agrococcus sp. TSP3-2-1]|uniref:hypothetical protein n=1 Tax=Agrococcus sp. TSP3-2-1 TaxID=2804583 RepID=UPI003CF8D873